MGTLLWRWNFALAIGSNQVPTVDVSLDRLVRAIDGSITEGINPARLLPYFIGRAGTEAELSALNRYMSRTGMGEVDNNGMSERVAELVGLALASPAFQRC
jgi:hypothetical protein